jgi:hypothetical protein
MVYNVKVLRAGQAAAGWGEEDGEIEDLTAKLHPGLQQKRVGTTTGGVSSRPPAPSMSKPPKPEKEPLVKRRPNTRPTQYAPGWGPIEPQKHSLPSNVRSFDSRMDQDVRIHPGFNPLEVYGPPIGEAGKNRSFGKESYGAKPPTTTVFAANNEPFDNFCNFLNPSNRGKIIFIMNCEFSDVKFKFPVHEVNVFIINYRMIIF